MSVVPVKIMVVDDEPKIRNLLRLGLSMFRRWPTLLFNI